MIYNSYHETKKLDDQTGLFLADDLYLSLDLFSKNKFGWDEDIIKYIKEQFSNCFFGKNFVDIGMNYGQYIMLLHDVFDHCYGFEPNKHIYNIACANMALHNISYRTTLYNYGLSDKEDVLRYAYVDELGGGNMFVKPDENDITNVLSHKLDGYNPEYRHYDNIPVKRLDDLNITNVGLFKIDVEGFELNVLNGAKQTIINSNYPPIIIESWNVDETDTPEVAQAKIELRDKVFNLLGGELGYAIKLIANDNFWCERV